MIGRTLSHYKILDELSRGGMGVVYRAVDVKLDREVALKVLPPELVEDEERKRRFVQEAKAAAALEHPHIGVIYEIDEAEGVTFIAMELIRGDKLGDVIQKERLSVSRALDLGIEVAEGLARAHDKGIAHRDLKPGNIMLTEDGHAKIIDFGLAKLVEPLTGGPSEAKTVTRRETDPGKIMGTVTYMSPEQARGIKVDHRSDVFSYGIVLYEMLSGKPPFQGATGMDTLHAIMKEPAPPLATLGGEVPEEAGREIRRVLDKCLAKEPGERYQTMKDAVVDMRTARRRLESGTMSAVSGVHAPVVESKEGRRPWAILGGVAAVIFLVAAILFFWRPSTEEVPSGTPSKPSLAVLYFENNTGDPSLDWLRTAITNMLVTDLSQSPQVRVLGTETLYQILKEMRRLDDRVTSLEVVQEVAERGDVDIVVLGNFVKAGDTIRISVRLQEASSGEILSTERVEGVGESSIFPMVDDLTRRIRANFETSAVAKVELDRDIKDLVTSSVEAYRYYEEGRRYHLLGKFKEAVLPYEKALAVDSGFAMALLRLAEVHGNQGHMKEAEEYVRRALEQADRLTARERYYIEGVYYQRKEGTRGRSIEAYEKVLELDPDNAARFNLAFVYYSLERFDEAIVHLEELTRRRYSFVGTPWLLARAYSAQRAQFDRGYEALQDYIARNPDTSQGHFNLGDHFTDWGKLDEALAAFEKAQSLSPGDPSPLVGMWRVFILREEWKRAQAAAQSLEELPESVWKYRGSHLLAVTRLYQGRSREGLTFLGRARAYAESGTRKAQADTDAARLLLEEGQAARALERAQQAQREGKGNYPEWEGLFLAALAQARLGHREDAETTAEALRRNTESLPTEKEKRRYHHLAGELALGRGDARVAIKELEQAQSMLPARGPMPLFLVAPQPQHVPVWFSLATAYLAAGEEEKAAERFYHITESTTEHIFWPIPYVRSFYFLGKIHENRGEWDKSREYYRRFSDFWKDGDMDRKRVEEALSKLS